MPPTPPPTLESGLIDQSVSLTLELSGSDGSLYSALQELQFDL